MSTPPSEVGVSKRTFAIVALALMLCVTGKHYLSSKVSGVAPNVVFTSLTGEKIPLQSLRGKIVMVNFWATSCGYCIHEMPQMAETYRRFKGRGFEIVAVAMSYDPPSAVLDYAQTRNVPFPVALDLQDELSHAFGDIDATPTSFLIGKDGNIIWRFVGVPDFSALQQSLDKALSAPG